MLLTKIISGAQTGVDRAALDFAIAKEINHGGFVPRGRLAEDGAVPAKYQVKELSSKDYPTRTRKNVLSSDGTLKITGSAANAKSRGTQLTIKTAKALNKPFLLVNTDDCDPSIVLAWLNDNKITCLNVAGPRESNNPGIATKTFALLEKVISTCGNHAKA